MAHSTALFITAAILELAATTACALFPMRNALLQRPNWRVVLSFYSPAGSNLDVWAQSAAHCLLFSLLMLRARLAPRARSPVTQPSHVHNRVRLTIKVLTVLCQLALLAKCIVIAVLGKDALLPDPEYPESQVGLAYLFGSVVVSLLGVSVQAATAGKAIKGWQEIAAAEAELLSPLLEDKGEGGSEEGSGAAAAAETAAQEKETKGKTIRTLLRLSLSDAPLLCVAFTAGAAAALGQALIPYYTGLIIDYASIDTNRTAFQTTTLKLILVSLACALATGVRGGLFSIAMARLNVRLRTVLFSALLNQEVGFFDTTKTGDITSRLSADTTTVSDQVCLNMNVMMRSLTQAAMVLAFMFLASWRLTVITFIMIPVIMAIVKFYGAYFRKLAKKAQTELAEANGVAEEVLSSMTTVRAHAAEDSSRVAYGACLRKFFLVQQSEAVAYTLYQIVSKFLPNVVAAVVLFFGGSMVLDGRMSPGALVSFMLYQTSLSGAFQSMGDVFSELTAAVGAAEKVCELINRTPAISRKGTLMPPDFRGRVELQGVDFSYPGRPNTKVLSNLSLQINPGEMVALVGQSGGGKSSIVNLLERHYLASAGAVLMDGRDVGVYDAKWLKRRVALVSQEPVLYGRSIRRNICFGLEAEDGVPPDEVPTEQDVQSAARLANAHEFIMAMPQGYDTDCGEKGVALSGGQKQRIAIARALVRRPTVLLLDEATSALDADSESLVQDALDHVMHNHTVLVIAHRLSTVKAADRIVVVAGGSVVETGTHDALLEAGGVYAGLVRRQLQRPTSSASIARDESE